MFVIGMELDIKVLKNKASEAVVISHASIVIPLRGYWFVLFCV
jgi:Kef-type K+ transport system membrane component KefB